MWVTLITPGSTCQGKGPHWHNWLKQILIGNGIEKRGLIRSVWESQAVKSEIGEFFIFDGNRIGW